MVSSALSSLDFAFADYLRVSLRETRDEREAFANSSADYRSRSRRAEEIFPHCSSTPGRILANQTQSEGRTIALPSLYARKDS